MIEYLYTVWLRDSSLPADSQDHEYPACIIIEAPSVNAATEWGDHLARSFCTRRSEMHFLNSQSEPLDAAAYDLSRVPRVQHGCEASDEEIGW